MVLKSLRTAVLATLIFTILTGVIYPLVVTGIAQLVFPGKANGSLIKEKGKILGSELIGQPFNDPKYFWPRPSATTPYEYNGGASNASNLGPLNPELIDRIKKRIQVLRAADPTNSLPVPVDLVTASGSGLDPHISVAAARYQTGRVARSRMMEPNEVRLLVEQYTEGRQLGFLGEPRVNVLKLNLALDHVQTASETR